MANTQRSRVSPQVLQADMDAYLSLKVIAGYQSSNPAHSLSAIAELYDRLRASLETELHAQHAFFRRLSFTPLFPAGWLEYKIHYRYRDTYYHIQVIRKEPKAALVRRVVVDTIEQPDLMISLVDDQIEHFVMVEVCD